MRCTGISDGCLNCWHLRTADRLGCNEGLPLDERKALIGEGPFILRERELSAPLRARKPAVIGVQFMGDLFHEAVPDQFIYEATRVMRHSLASMHTFLLLTKRLQKMLRLSNLYDELPNVWSGLTVCNQQEADEKIPIFLKVPGKKFLSIEPMLSEIDLTWTYDEMNHRGDGVTQFERIPFGIDAVILGAETGPGARPMHPDWVRSVRDQCAAAGVPFFFKGWGEWIPIEEMGTVRYEKNKTKSRIIDMEMHDDLPWRAAL